jgi:hypothetical protein
VASNILRTEKHLITTRIAHLQVSLVGKLVVETRDSENICGLFGQGGWNSIKLLETRGSPAGVDPTIGADGHRSRRKSSTGRHRCLVNKGLWNGSRSLGKASVKLLQVGTEQETT